MSHYTSPVSTLPHQHLPLFLGNLLRFILVHLLSLPTHLSSFCSPTRSHFAHHSLCYFGSHFRTFNYSLLLLPLTPLLQHIAYSIMVTYSHICFSYLTLSFQRAVSGFFLSLLFSVSKGSLVPSSDVTDRQQYLCFGGRCRLSPCQHGCGQTHDNGAATSLGGPQRVQWFGRSQGRDHTHLLGKIYLSAKIKPHGSSLSLFNIARRKRGKT